jgi:indolepyruvate ferredoxin oxidoreductase beta subunit
VILGAADYPADLEKKLKEQEIEFTGVDALKLAEQAGSAKAVNVVLLGLLAGQMSFSEQDWKDAIASTVPARFLDMNLKAFALSSSRYKGM